MKIVTEEIRIQTVKFMERKNETMVCVNCQIDAKKREITCNNCGYEKSQITHTMANLIAVQREEKKAEQIRKNRSHG